MKKITFITNLMILSTLLGMQNKNTQEDTNDLVKNHMASVQEQNTVSSENYENFTNQDWVKKIVRMSLSGADFNIPQNEKKETLLMCAARYADDKILRQILNIKDEKGTRLADVNAKDIKGNTALSIVVQQINPRKSTSVISRWGQSEISENSSFEKVDFEKKMLVLMSNGADIELAKKAIAKDNKRQKILDSFYRRVKNDSDLFGRNVVFNPEKAELLLDKGYVAINWQDNSQQATALMFSAVTNNIGWTQKLLNQGADVNLQNKKGNTALIMAVIDGYTETVKMLLDKGADVNIQNEKGDTALIIAAGKGYTEIVKMLLDRGINVNLQDNEGDTALIIAAGKGYTEIVKMLLDKGADVNIQNEKGDTALIIAAGKGYTEIVKMLLDKGADVNIQNEKGDTALIIAADRNHYEIVELLMNKGVDINKKNHNECTALMLASKHGHESVVEKLLESTEINVDSCEGSIGGTALAFAAANGYMKIVDMLLSKNANVNIKLISGRSSLLMFIISLNNKCMFDKLLNARGIDIDLEGRMGSTALIHAALCNRDEMVRMLLNKKADINHKTVLGRSVLHLAVIKAIKGMVEELIKHKTLNVNVKDYLKNTALVYAVKSGNTDIVKLLLARDEVDVNCEDVFKNTPLMLAVKNEDVAMVELLLTRSDINLYAKNDQEETISSCAKNAIREKIKRLIYSKLNLQEEIYLDKVISEDETVNRAEVFLLKERFFNAAKNGDINEMDAVLSQNESDGKFLIDINDQDKNGDTALIMAAKKGYNLVVRSLIEHGADISIKNKKGYTALSIAADFGNYDAVELLISKNEYISLKNIGGDNALIKAASKGHVSVVSLLLNNGVNPNPKAAMETALMAATKNGQINVVKLLLKNNAKVSAKDSSGKTALDLINNKKEKIYLDIRNLLLNASSSNNDEKQSDKLDIKELMLYDDQEVWDIVSTQRYDEELSYWKNSSESNNFVKIQSLINDMRINPFNSYGQTEALQGNLKGLYSKRIDKEHRLVFAKVNTKICLLSCQNHYDVNYLDQIRGELNIK